MFLAKHIYNVEGLKGCYRGLIPWLSSSLLYRYSQKKVEDLFPKVVNEGRNEEDLTADERYVECYVFLMLVLCFVELGVRETILIYCETSYNTKKFEVK